LENDVKGEINAIVGRAVIELLMLHNTVSCELLVKTLYEHSEKTNDETLRLNIRRVIHRLLNTMH
jgi:hypothetical protein